MVAAVAIAMAFVLASRSANAIDVVETWIEARNEGDITALMEMLSSDGVIFEFPMSIQSRRQMLETLFRSQVVAGHHIEESSCRAEGEIVRCRYVMNDAFTRTVGASFTGEHIYVIRAGLIHNATRIHDIASRDDVYRRLEDFRMWVASTHPELESVIWSDRRAVFYVNEQGAAALLAILDDYRARLSGSDSE